MKFNGLPWDMQDKISRCLETFNRKIPILLLGETGVGKSYLARIIHENSVWRKGEFIRIDISSLENELFEAELFGYEKGAFTGALKGGKKGLLDRAQGGTVFFDEIGNLDLRYQKKLLIFLDDRRYRRVGGNRFIQLEAGLIFATNIDLLRAVKNGIFRQDLYFRINSCVIEIPPLRERSNYLLEIIDDLIKHKGLKKVKFTENALKKLKEYTWPGNVRELLNYIIHWNISGLETVDVENLPDNIRNLYSVYNLKESVNRYRLEHVRRVMKISGGDTKMAAKLLGISRQHLYRLLKQMEEPLLDDLEPPYEKTNDKEG